MSSAHPIVVLVHGFLGVPEDWDPIRKAMSARGFADTVAVDVRACARSKSCAAALARAAQDDPSLLPATDGLDALAAAVQRDIMVATGDAAALGRPVVLCGYSLGGRICLALACRARDPLPCIVIGADPGIEDPRERSLRAGRDHAHAMHLLADPGAFVSAWYAQPLFASLRTSASVDAVVARRRASLADRDTREAWALILDACSPGRCVPRWTDAARLGDRLAVVHGALDDKFAAIARRLHVLSPGVPTISVPGAGHAAHVEQPEACADAIVSALAAPLHSRS